MNEDQNQPNQSIASSLLYRAQHNDDEAWDRVNQLFGPLINGWIRKAGIPAADADDISQQVLQQIFRTIGNFQREKASDTFTGWVWTITRFKILDHYERQKNEMAASGGSIANQMMQQVSGKQLDSSIYDSESADVMLTRKALSLVKSEFENNTWDAFWRSTVQREKPADIAKSMKMTLHAVYKAKSRVMRRVREELDGIVHSDAIADDPPAN